MVRHSSDKNADWYITAVNMSSDEWCMRHSSDENVDWGGKILVSTFCDVHGISTSYVGQFHVEYLRYIYVDDMPQ